MTFYQSASQHIGAHSTEHAPVPDIHVRIGSDTSAGRVALIETVEVPGMEPPYHRHQEADILIYVVAGELTLYLAGAAIVAPAGSAHWVPCGTEYTFAVVSPQAYVLTLFLPAGFEQFYTELGPAPWRAVERSIATAARYGCEITAPHPCIPRDPSPQACVTGATAADHAVPAIPAPTLPRPVT
jgi:quercetin dioxygenase-like cupin family protein